MSVHRPGFYAHRFLDFMADKGFKKIPSRKFHFRNLFNFFFYIFNKTRLAQNQRKKICFLLTIFISCKWLLCLSFNYILNTIFSRLNVSYFMSVIFNVKNIYKKVLFHYEYFTKKIIENYCKKFVKLISVFKTLYIIELLSKNNYFWMKFLVTCKNSKIISNKIFYFILFILYKYLEISLSM